MAHRSGGRSLRGVTIPPMFEVTRQAPHVVLQSMVEVKRFEPSAPRCERKNTVPK